MRYLLRKIISLLFRLRFDIIIDEVKSAHEYWRVKRLKTGFRAIGNNFRLGPDPILVNTRYMEIGDGFFALARVRLEAYDTFDGQEFKPSMKIGANVILNTDCHIGCINSITLGDNVLIASRVFITDHFHGDASDRFLHLPPAQRPLTSRGPVHIADNVWIGEGVAILPGVTIGEGAIIGANSVVTKDIPAYAAAGGIPCKVIRMMRGGQEP